jgi:hypothetical protein
MPAQSTNPAALAQRIQQLLTERQQHEDAVSRIDQILGRVGAALGTGSAIARGSRGTAKATNGRATKAKLSAGGGGKKRRRKRGSFKTTGEQSILEFVKKKGKPTGREIEVAWKGEGRGGPAANTLSKLVKDRKLKREPLEGQRGSRYVLP